MIDQKLEPGGLCIIIDFRANSVCTYEKSLGKCVKLIKRVSLEYVVSKNNVRHYGYDKVWEKLDWWEIEHTTAGKISYCPSEALRKINPPKEETTKWAQEDLPTEARLTVLP